MKQNLKMQSIFLKNIKLYKPFLILSLSIIQTVFSNQIFAQPLQVILQQPLPYKFLIEDMWKITLINSFAPVDVEEGFNLRQDEIEGPRLVAAAGPDRDLPARVREGAGGAERPGSPRRGAGRGQEARSRGDPDPHEGGAVGGGLLGGGAAPPGGPAG